MSSSIVITLSAKADSFSEAIPLQQQLLAQRMQQPATLTCDGSIRAVEGLLEQHCLPVASGTTAYLRLVSICLPEAYSGFHALRLRQTLIGPSSTACRSLTDDLSIPFNIIIPRPDAKVKHMCKKGAAPHSPAA